ncbi:hypothetical protein [Enterovirga rhinocerotis]|uniref:Uncharacterized protein n=1 Tax=Enterovirga rhinocerotis TaxID=1339210 RepID=A0A4R7CDL2_9HYPH|nr:hypothetical protein [Enterovirga rhinocerotis]TDR95319.1 hypothetical protein EV668_0092 [Enterovirga rhinocerotis]
MSTNDLERPSSRRSFLAGLYAAFTVAPVTIASAAPLHPADRAFLEWVGAVSAYNRCPFDAEDSRSKPLWAAVEEAERIMWALPPSIMSAACIMLVEASYNLTASAPIRIADACEKRRADFLVLIALRPHLTGIIGNVVADLLDHPERPAGESLVWRLRSGEARA